MITAQTPTMLKFSSRVSMKPLLWKIALLRGGIHRHRADNFIICCTTLSDLYPFMIEFKHVYHATVKQARNI